MIVAECLKEIKVKMDDDNQLILEEGKRYVSSDMVFEQFHRLYPNHWGKIENFDKNYYREYKGEDLSGKTFMCWRTGGIGDVLFLLPCIRILKEKYPTCTIIAASASPNKHAYQNNPYISEFYDVPFPFEIAQRADYHLTFQGIIEENPRASEITAVDLFLERFKFNPSEIPAEKKVPQLFLSEKEKNYVNEIVLSKNLLEKYKIAYQILSSSPIRTFPTRRNIDIISEILEDEDNVIFLFGSPKEAGIHTNIVDVFPEHKKQRIFSTAVNNFSLRNSFALLARMNLVIGPDSSIMHMAGAFQVPMIGLYGPFPSRVRLAYYKKAIGLDASVACAPCFTHGNSPCYKSVSNNESPCFSVITEKTIFEAINIQKIESTGKQFKTDKIVIYNEFEKLLIDHPEIEQYMVGDGIDIGSGKRCLFHDKFNIKTMDINPLYRPNVVQEAEKLGTFNQQYDYIIASFLLNCSPHPMLLTEQMFKSVKSGGYIIIYIPEFMVYPDPNEELFKFNGHGTALTHQHIETLFADKRYFINELTITHVTDGLTKDNFDLKMSAKLNYGFCYIVKVIKEEVEKDAVT